MKVGSKREWQKYCSYLSPNSKTSVFLSMRLEKVYFYIQRPKRFPILSVYVRGYRVLVGILFSFIIVFNALMQHIKVWISTSKHVLRVFAIKRLNPPMILSYAFQ